MGSSSRSLLLWIFLTLIFFVDVAQAQFGVGGKKRQQQPLAQDDNNINKNDNKNSRGGGGLDLKNDPELLAAMEIFAGMSPEEMEETMNELKEMLGNDPETLAAINEVMEEMKQMDAADIKSSLEQMVADDEVAKATQDALKLIHKSSWETIWEKQADILDAVIQSGQISAEDAALFKSDQDKWEMELRFIWNELQKQAADNAKEEL